ncbi:right-handed parallel beta-helix repeat-containing protein [Dyadobacter sp. CY343]|uniref:right-handed parallel beta-helix repeat-containing protein n=1 Tax=Dyadobacter sp. CY343 TaxID=2907299 RepID=UPI001F2BA14D|nr:right-handed parallel beta-helix repeat-containing protein [Dyadobacter sp. CY343]MCE7059701.1 right-handed parallel beta-helix repeat-containing protein [Dyadobacter sp. CY343]
MRKLSSAIMLFSILIVSGSARPSIREFAFFVSTKGSDSKKGTKEEPFRNLSKALETVVSVPGNSSITIYFRDGTYMLSNTASINNTTLTKGKQLTLTSYGNEKVFLTGGSNVNSSDFQKVTDGAILRKIPTTSRNNVYALDLGRYASNDISLHKNGYGQPRKPSPIELFINEDPASLARWPKDSTISIVSVVPAAEISGGEKAAFTTGAILPTRWESPSHIWIAGALTKNWAFDNLPVLSLEPKKNLVRLSDKAKYKIVKAPDKRRQQFGDSRTLGSFFFYNVTEELTRNREYVMDPQSKKLYVYLDSESDLEKCSISTLATPLIEISNTEAIRIKGLNFGLGRSSAIKISRSSNILIENCTFKNFGLLAIDAANCMKLKVQTSTIMNTGSGAIVMSGGNRKTLQPSENYIENCVITNFSRLYRSYSPAINIQGVGITVKNNDISVAPGQAIIFQGNDHVISYNNISDVCQEFGDVGAIYTGRDPSSTGTMIIHNLFGKIQNEASPLVTAIYIDDGSGGFSIANNIFLESGTTKSNGFGAIHINGGSHTNIDNNVFLNCRKAFSYKAWTDKKWKQTFITNKENLARITQTVDIRSKIFQKKYPHLQNFFALSSSKKRENYVDGNYFYNVGKIDNSPGYIIHNSITTQGNSDFSPKRQRALQEDDVPAEVKQSKSWKNIEFDKIGAKFTDI